MSENYYEPASPSGTDVASIDDTSTLDTAKHEASALKDTTVEQAKDVAGTAKQEAAAVALEAKSQAKDLYAQTQRELKEQASTQQQRVAAGLQSVSHELGSMSANAENPGVAADLVRQLSGRLSGAATWLNDRDPAAVLTEVKRYARRKPGTFILGAAIAGIVFGRLARALASNASASDGAAAMQSGSSPAQRSVAGPVIGSDETPLYTQAAATLEDGFSEGGRDVRSDSV